MNSVDQGPPFYLTETIVEVADDSDSGDVAIISHRRAAGGIPHLENTSVGHCSWVGEGVIVEKYIDWKIVHSKS